MGLVVVVVVDLVDFLSGSGLEEEPPRLKSLPPSVALRLRRPLPLPCRE